MSLKIKAVILIGGETKGTRFRPLSLDVPKPFFPIAGMPMIHHHIAALKQLEGLLEIILIGFYEGQTISTYIGNASREFGVKLRYLREPKECGTAGGLLHFKEQILDREPDLLLVMNCDICCSFPLQQLISAHQANRKPFTIMSKKIDAKEAQFYGCLVADADTKEALHYAEKPETFVSDVINCGIYCFDPLKMVQCIEAAKDRKAQLPLISSPFYDTDEAARENISLEKDVLIPAVNDKLVAVFETSEFWCQIKSAGASVHCSELYLQQYRLDNPQYLAPISKSAPEIVGNVVINSTAEIHPTAKIGPNVTIGAGVKICAGARVANSIILEGVEIKEHACVTYSILGWNSTVGRWTRVEGSPLAKTSASTKGHAQAISDEEDKITIFGVGVVAAHEIVVRNCIVLPNKHLSESISNKILL